MELDGERRRIEMRGVAGIEMDQETDFGWRDQGVQRLITSSAKDQEHRHTLVCVNEEC